MLYTSLLFVICNKFVKNINMNFAIKIYRYIYPVAYFKQLHEQLSSFKSKQIPVEEKTPKERMKNLKINV